jgi:PAS domain S-box-containing protein
MRERRSRDYRAFLARVNQLSAPGGGASGGAGLLDERYRYVLENLRALTVDIAPDGHIAYISPSVTNVLGFEPNEIIGNEGFAWVHRDDLIALAEAAHQLREHGEPFKGIVRVRHKEGHWIWMEISAAGAYQPPTGPTVTVIFARDVSDVKSAKDALAESEDRFHALTEHASDIIAEVDSDGRVCYLSPSFSAALGRRPEEILGKSIGESGIADNLYPEDYEPLKQRFEGGLAVGQAHATLLAYRFRHADGTWRWFESQTTPYRTRRGELRNVVVSRDVTERVHAEVELRESEKRYRILGESSRDMIAELDDDGRILYVSPGCADVLGHPPESLLGRSGFSLIHPDDKKHNAETFLETLKEEGPVRSEPYRVHHRDGSWRWVEGVGVLYRRADGDSRILSVTRDVTERLLAEEQRRKFEEQMRHAQKLEGLGVMAGGIAHDFNNLLTPILGNASLALLDLPQNSPVRQRIEKIHKAALRAATLTNQMLAYAGVGPVAVAPLDLSRVVAEMAQLLESSISG